jgi:hypothetical protein
MRLPLAAPLISRDGTLVKDAGITNGMIDPNGEVLNRPGSADYGLVLAGQAQGLQEFDTVCYAVVDDTLKRLDVSGASPSELTSDTLSPKAADLQFTFEPNGASETPQVFLKNRDQAWVYEP